MNSKLLLTIVAIFFLLLNSCSEDYDGETGTLIIKGVKTMPELKSAAASSITMEENGAYIMHTTDVLFSIDKIWASVDEVVEGLEDDFTWIEIGKGDGLKSVSEFLFTADNLPVGDYKSIKISFFNKIIRHAVYQSDHSKTVEMQGSLGEESCGDNSKAINYFSKRGSFSADKNNSFQLGSSGENIRGFKISANSTTTIYWQSGFPGFVFTDCWFTWNDVNDNKTYDCGVDYTNEYDCSKEGAMWTFTVDDGEEVEVEVEENTFFSNAVSDIDGNSYNATKIGNQTWLTENLKTTKLNDGSVIQLEHDYSDNCTQTGECPDPTKESPPPLYQYRNYQTEFINIYGLTYNWTAVESGKLCPQGWHVPTLAEWNQLIGFLGENGSGKLRVVQFDPDYMWQPNDGATNEYEFSALPGGAYIGLSTPLNFDFNNNVALFISSTNEGQALTPIIPFIIIGGSSSEITIDRAGYDSFLSCRCIKD
jgi:uncharacterized protein (TIGR02145 family)